MSPEENTQDTSGGTGPTDAPSQAAAAAPTEAAPPQVQADQQVDPTTTEAPAKADELASDGEAVKEGVQEEGGDTNASQA